MIMGNSGIEHVSIPGLDIKSGLKRAGKVSIYLSFLRNFYDCGKHYRSELQSTLLAENQTKFREKLHGLRGVAATLSAFELDQSCAAALKKPGKSIDEIPPELIGNVFHALDRLLGDIEYSGIFEQQQKLHSNDKIKNNAGFLQACELVLIEDDPVFRKLVSDGLLSHFGNITRFGLMQDVLSFLEQGRAPEYTVFIIDVKLADGCGIELARTISQCCPDAFILLMSGDEILPENQPEIKKCVFLLKPFLISDLLRILSHAALASFEKKDLRAV